MYKRRTGLDDIIDSMYANQEYKESSNSGDSNIGNIGSGGGERACGAQLLTEAAISVANIQRFLVKYPPAWLSNAANDVPAWGDGIFKAIKSGRLTPILKPNYTETGDLAVGANPRAFINKAQDFVYNDRDKFELIKYFDYLAYAVHDAAKMIKYWNDNEQIFKRRFPSGIFSLPVTNMPAFFNELKKVKIDVENSKEYAERRLKQTFKNAQQAIVYQDEDYIIVDPSTYEMSRTFFGYPTRTDILTKERKPGAKWCVTSTDGESHFQRYKGNSTLLYIQKKNSTNPEDELFAVRLNTEMRSYEHLYEETVQELNKIQNKFNRDVTQSSLYVDSFDYHIIKSLRDSELMTYINESILLEARDQENRPIGEKFNSGVDYYLESVARKLFGPFRLENFDKVINFITLIFFNKPYIRTHQNESYNSSTELLTEMVLSGDNIRRFIIRFFINDKQPEGSTFSKLKIQDPEVIRRLKDFSKKYSSFTPSITDGHIFEGGATAIWLADVFNNENSPRYIGKVFYPGITSSDSLALYYMVYTAVHTIRDYNKVQQLFDAKYPGGLLNYSGNWLQLEKTLKDLAKELQTRKLNKDYKRLGGSQAAAQKDIIYQDDACILIEPSSFEMSCVHFGAPVRRDIIDNTQKPGAHWCTASSSTPGNREHFNNYKQNFYLTYIQKKNSSNPDKVLYATRVQRHHIVVNKAPGKRYKVVYKQETNTDNAVKIFANNLIETYNDYIKDVESKGLKLSEYKKYYGTFHEEFFGVLNAMVNPVVDYVPRIVEVRDQKNQDIAQHSRDQGPFYKLIKGIYGPVTLKNFSNVLDFLCVILYRQRSPIRLS